MAPINVLVSDELSEDVIPEIEAIDPRINARHVGCLITAETLGDRDASALLDGMLETADIYAGIRIPADLLRRAPRLKWIQVTRAGVDRLLMNEQFRQSRIILTNVGGVHSYGPAELAIQACLVHVKGTLECARQKQSRVWETFQPGVLKGHTMGIIGYGSIGQKVARVAKAFDMRVIATRRSTKRPTGARYADLLLPLAQIHRLLSESDFVVMATPLTPDTYHLIGPEQLSLMKNDALLVNVSRGPSIDESALATALKQGWIAAAALDVFEQEPLPQDSPLWDLPNVMYSPHIAGNVPGYPRLVKDVFLQNLGRFVRDEPLRSVVNKHRGY